MESGTQILSFELRIHSWRQGTGQFLELRCLCDETDVVFQAPSDDTQQKHFINDKHQK